MAAVRGKVVSASPDPTAADRVRAMRLRSRYQAAYSAALAVAMVELDWDDVSGLTKELEASKITMPALQELQALLMARVNIQRDDEGRLVALGGPRINPSARSTKTRSER